MALWTKIPNFTPVGSKAFDFGTSDLIPLITDQYIILAQGPNIAVWDMVANIRTQLRPIPSKPNAPQTNSDTAQQALSVQEGNQEIALPPTVKITAWRTLPQEKLLAATDEGTLIIWDLKTANPPQILCVHTNAITALDVLSPKEICTSSIDGEIAIANIHENIIAAKWQGHNVAITNIHLLSNGNILSVANNKTLKHWDRSGKSIQTLSQPEHSGSNQFLALLPNDIGLITSFHGFKIFDCHTGEIIKEISKKYIIPGVTATYNRPIVISESQVLKNTNHGLELLDLATESQEKLFDSNAGGIKVLSFIPDGRLLLQDTAQKILLVDVGLRQNLENAMVASADINPKPESSSCEFFMDARTVVQHNAFYSTTVVHLRGNIPEATLHQLEQAPNLVSAVIYGDTSSDTVTNLPAKITGVHLPEHVEEKIIACLGTQITSVSIYPNTSAASVKALQESVTLAHLNGEVSAEVSTNLPASISEMVVYTDTDEDAWMAAPNTVKRVYYYDNQTESDKHQTKLSLLQKRFETIIEIGGMCVYSVNTPDGSRTVSKEYSKKLTANLEYTSLDRIKPLPRTPLQIQASDNTLRITPETTLEDIAAITETTQFVCLIGKIQPNIILALHKHLHSIIMTGETDWQTFVDFPKVDIPVALRGYIEPRIVEKLSWHVHNVNVFPDTYPETLRALKSSVKVLGLCGALPNSLLQIIQQNYCSLGIHADTRWKDYQTAHGMKIRECTLIGDLSKAFLSEAGEFTLTNVTISNRTGLQSLRNLQDFTECLAFSGTLPAEFLAETPRTINKVSLRENFSPVTLRHIAPHMQWIKLGYKFSQFAFLSSIPQHMKLVIDGNFHLIAYLPPECHNIYLDLTNYQSRHPSPSFITTLGLVGAKVPSYLLSNEAVKSWYQNIITKIKTVLTNLVITVHTLYFEYAFLDAAKMIPRHVRTLILSPKCSLQAYQAMANLLAERLQDKSLLLEVEIGKEMSIDILQALPAQYKTAHAHCDVEPEHFANMPSTMTTLHLYPGITQEALKTIKPTINCIYLHGSWAAEQINLLNPNANLILTSQITEEGEEEKPQPLKEEAKRPRLTNYDPTFMSHRASSFPTSNTPTSSSFRNG